MRLPKTAAPILAVAVTAAVATGCGGSSKSTSTSTTSTTTSTKAHGTTTTKSRPTKPLQQLRVNTKGAQPGSSVNVNPGQVVAVAVHVPATDVGKKVNIAIDQTTPTTFAVTSAVLGTPLKATGTITASAPGLEISAMHWACKYPSTRSFCPVTVLSSSHTHVKLEAKSSTVPVAVATLFNHPGSVRSPRLIPQGPPSPTSSVQAKLLVVVPPKSKGTKPVPSTSVTASPGSIVNVRVQPIAGTPAHATLRIGIPHTSGNAITVQAGGTGTQPSSTATINSSSGALRISGMAWVCALPPATFCPFSSIKTTFSGVEISVPAPQVPVTLTLLTAKA